MNQLVFRYTPNNFLKIPPASYILDWVFINKTFFNELDTEFECKNEWLPFSKTNI